MELSICQITVEGDCVQAMNEGYCPCDTGRISTCDECLVWHRFDRDDANWLPEGEDTYRGIYAHQVPEGLY